MADVFARTGAGLRIARHLKELTIHSDGRAECENEAVQLSGPDLLVVTDQSVLPCVYIPVTSVRFIESRLETNASGTRLLPPRSAWPATAFELSRLVTGLTQIANRASPEAGDLCLRPLLVLVQVPTERGVVVQDELEVPSTSLQESKSFPVPSAKANSPALPGAAGQRILSTALRSCSHYPLLKDLQIEGATRKFKAIGVRNEAEAAAQIQLLVQSTSPLASFHTNLGLNAAVLRAGAILCNATGNQPERIEYALSRHSLAQLSNMTKSDLAEALGRSLENLESNQGKSEVRKIDHAADRLVKFFDGATESNQP